jgi:hypothetical protein
LLQVGPHLETCQELHATLVAELRLRDELRELTNLPIHAVPFLQACNHRVTTV